MAASATLSNSILIITSATLFWVALRDFKEFKIRNELVLVLVGLFFVYSLASGRWVELHWHLGLAALMFAVMLYYYAQSLMGGGDVKLLAVAFLWTGPWCAVPFAILLLAFIGVHMLAVKFGWAEAQKSKKGNRIPLAPSVAGALIGTFAIGCLSPVM
jgi:prepilin peptidase CpaA